MCPACGGPLIVVEFEGVEVDHCCACHGLWFDAGELDVLVSLGGGDAERLRAALATTPTERSGRRCLRCGRRLQTVAVGDAPAVQVERCRVGHGFWLDAGELDRVALAATGGAGTPEGRAVAAFLAELFRYRVGDSTKG